MTVVCKLLLKYVKKYYAMKPHRPILAGNFLLSMTIDYLYLLNSLLWLLAFSTAVLGYLFVNRFRGETWSFILRAFSTYIIVKDMRVVTWKRFREKY